MKRKRTKVLSDTRRCPNGWPVSKDFKTWPIADQEEWVLSVFRDEYESQGTEGLVAFMEHCGIKHKEADPNSDVEGVILSHYRHPSGRGYDCAQVPKDLMTFPPVAARIRYLQLERKAQAKVEAGQRITQNREAKRRQRKGVPDTADDGSTPAA